MNLDQASGAEKLVRTQAGERVGHRQAELFDGPQRRVVERDDGAALVHEIAQLIHAPLTDAADVAFGNGAFAVSFHDDARLRFWKHDHVIMFAEMAGLKVGIVEILEGKLVLLEDPARPAFIDIGLPRPIETGARGLHGLAAFLNRDGLKMIRAHDRIELRFIDPPHRNIAAVEPDVAFRRQDLIHRAQAGVRVAMERRGQPLN